MAEHALVAANAALAESRGDLQAAADAYADAADRWERFGVVPEHAFDRGGITERRYQDVWPLDVPWDYPFIRPLRELADSSSARGSPGSSPMRTWSPDFPTSAQGALRLYTNESGDARIDRGPRAHHMYDRNSAILRRPGRSSRTEDRPTVPGGTRSAVGASEGDRGDDRRPGPGPIHSQLDSARLLPRRGHASRAGTGLTRAHR